MALEPLNFWTKMFPGTYLEPNVMDTSHAMTIDQDLRQPYSVLETLGNTSGDKVTEGRDMVFRLLDGVTRGVIATDAAGATIVDASGYTTYVGTGLLRDQARDAQGHLLFDSLGRPCFAIDNPAANPAKNFGTAAASLEPSDFMGWDTASQLEYMRAHGTAISGTTSTTDKQLQVGSSSTTRIINVVMSSDEKTIYVIETMQKSDFAKMVQADQKSIAATTAFRTGAAVTLGLEPSGSTTEADARTALESIISSARAGFVASATVPASEAGKEDSLYMNDYNLNIFKDELDALKERLDATSVFVPKDIQDKVTEIQTRFKRADAFAKNNSYNEGTSTLTFTDDDLTVSTGYQLPTDVRSDDHNVTITNGFKKFMAQEAQIRNVDRARLSLAQQGELNGKRMDAPNLVFLLQLDYNLSDEAKNAAATEEVNQTNALLRTYSAMQQLINKVTGEFDTKETDEKRTINTGKDSRNWTTYYNDVPNTTTPATSSYIIAMFDSTYMAAGSRLAPHPIETLKGLSRPTFSILSVSNDDKKNDKILRNEKKNYWDQISTRLADAVTQINQESQIKMNDINSLDKQKNRHFDLANNALSKMNDMIQNIARSVA